MPIQATCPECRTVFRLADTIRRTKVRCSHCKTVFTAGAAAANGFMHWIKQKIGERTLRAAITRNGGATLGSDW
jgi:predicted Zn finger-like uncharacterized protein